jgi:hypothetical protein
MLRRAVAITGKNSSSAGQRHGECIYQCQMIIWVSHRLTVSNGYTEGANAYMYENLANSLTLRDVLSCIRSQFGGWKHKRREDQASSTLHCS